MSNEEGKAMDFESGSFDRYQLNLYDIRLLYLNST
jgi:hypothetical protein